MVGVDRMANYLKSILSPLTSHPSPLKKQKNHEYTNKKGDLEADSSAHSFNRYGDSNHAGRYQLHGSKRIFLKEKNPI